MPVAIKKTAIQLAAESARIAEFHLNQALRLIQTISGEDSADAEFTRAEATNEIHIALEWLEEIEA